MGDVHNNLNETEKPKSTTNYDIDGNVYCEPVNSYDRSASYEYFKRNVDLENENEGAAYMIGLAISCTKNGYKRLEDDDVIIYLLLSSFVSNLTRN